MSLAYKLWKIGSVLTKEDIKKCLKEEPDISDDSNYLNINFQFNDNQITYIEIKENSISKNKMFFTKKTGGSGSGIYYLYPNINAQNEIPERKLQQLSSTIEKSIAILCNTENKIFAEQIFELMKDVKKYISMAKKRLKNPDAVIDENLDKDFLTVCEKIIQKEKGNYWIWLSINGKTFPELMPEVGENWFKCPVIKNDNAKEGTDIFTNKKTIIGYRPEVKVFSYDNYHSSLDYRINDNLSLSLESARNIKFAWMYILNNLCFYYKGLEYILIPNMLSGSQKDYQKIIYNLKTANDNTNKRKSSIASLEQEEKQIDKRIEKIKRKIKKITDKNEKLHSELKSYEKEMAKIHNELFETDVGIIKEFNKQISELGELKNSLTLDFLFTKINRTNLSFEIKGSIEDVVPSQISQVIKAMKEYNINDLVTLKRKNYEEVYLQEFFNREELYFVLNRSTQNNANKILSERLFLARLLLTDNKIKIEHLLKRFEINREYDLENKKRINNAGVKEWIEYSSSFTKKENTIIKFLYKLNKIKE